MTAWIGMFALALAFCGSLVGTVLWVRSAASGTLTPPRWTAAVPALGAAGAVAAVEWALLTHDFSLRFVAENGSRATPVYYTVTSLWAAHDGSLLLWVLILTGYLLAVAVRRPGPAGLHTWAMAVLSLTVAFFSGLALFTGHVFDVVTPVPPDGPGPTPLLQDHPAMGIHPPLLYTGLLGTSVPFAYAVAALVTGRLGRGWITVVRSYALVSWTALTAGIVMGAWWSYSVLGWGGYWAWDPVENASLMPWLVATALLHSAMVQRRRGALPVWNLALAVAAFLLACLGSFLTRSGVVTSVHAFADSSVGPVLLGFVAAMAVGVVVLVLLRADRLGATRPTGPLVSRGSAILLNNLLLVALTVTVLVGTLYPLLAEWTSGARVSVGPPYFDRMAVPVALLLLLLMAVGPMLRWRGEGGSSAGRRLVAPLVVGACVVVAVALLAPAGPATLLTFGLGAFVLASAVIDTVSRIRRSSRGRAGGRTAAAARWLVGNRRRVAGLVVHAGLVLVAVGVAASSAYTSVHERTLRAGQSVTVSGLTVRLASVERARDAETMSTGARLAVSHDGRTATAEPRLRFFPQHAQTVASPAVMSGVGGDVYLTLLSAGQEGATLRIAVNPMVGWIWAGGAVMVLGSLTAMVPRRRRAAAEAPEHLPEAPAVLEAAQG